MGIISINNMPVTSFRAFRILEGVARSAALERHDHAWKTIEGSGPGDWWALAVGAATTFDVRQFGINGGSGESLPERGSRGNSVGFNNE
jgi:hypothetical protein